jgi:hypothetical protein
VAVGGSGASSETADEDPAKPDSGREVHALVANNSSPYSGPSTGRLTGVGLFILGTGIGSLAVAGVINSVLDFVC